MSGSSVSDTSGSMCSRSSQAYLFGRPVFEAHRFHIAGFAFVAEERSCWHLSTTLMMIRLVVRLAELPNVAVAALLVGNLEIVSSVREQVRLAAEMRCPLATGNIRTELTCI